MDDRQQRLLDSIERAFHGVELGNGVSLHEAKVVDDYDTRAQRLAARTSDEKHDWRKLIDDPKLLQLCRLGALSFFDAAGLKFHLPACLSRAVKEPTGTDRIMPVHVPQLVKHLEDSGILAETGGPRLAC